MPPSATCRERLGDPRLVHAEGDREFARVLARALEAYRLPPTIVKGMAARAVAPAQPLIVSLEQFKNDEAPERIDDNYLIIVAPSRAAVARDPSVRERFLRSCAARDGSKAILVIPPGGDPTEIMRSLQSTSSRWDPAEFLNMPRWSVQLPLALKLSRSSLRKVVAPLLGVPDDLLPDLHGIETRQRRRTAYRALAIALVGIAALLGASLYYLRAEWLAAAQAAADDHWSRLPLDGFELTHAELAELRRVSEAESEVRERFLAHVFTQQGLQEALPKFVDQIVRAAVGFEVPFRQRVLDTLVRQHLGSGAVWQRRTAVIVALALQSSSEEIQKEAERLIKSGNEVGFALASRWVAVLPGLEGDRLEAAILLMLEVFSLRGTMGSMSFPQPQVNHVIQSAAELPEEALGRLYERTLELLLDVATYGDIDSSYSNAADLLTVATLLCEWTDRCGDAQFGTAFEQALSLLKRNTNGLIDGGYFQALHKAGQRLPEVRAEGALVSSREILLELSDPRFVPYMAPLLEALGGRGAFPPRQIPRGSSQQSHTPTHDLLMLLERGMVPNLVPIKPPAAIIDRLVDRASEMPEIIEPLLELLAYRPTLVSADQLRRLTLRLAKLWHEGKLGYRSPYAGFVELALTVDDTHGLAMREALDEARRLPLEGDVAGQLAEIDLLLLPPHSPRAWVEIITSVVRPLTLPYGAFDRGALDDRSALSAQLAAPIEAEELIYRLIAQLRETDVTWEGVLIPRMGAMLEALGGRLCCGTELRVAGVLGATLERWSSGPHRVALSRGLLGLATVPEEQTVSAAKILADTLLTESPGPLPTGTPESLRAMAQRLTHPQRDILAEYILDRLERADQPIRLGSRVVQIIQPEIPNMREDIWRRFLSFYMSLLPCSTSADETHELVRFIGASSRRMPKEAGRAILIETLKQPAVVGEAQSLVVTVLRSLFSQEDAPDSLWPLVRYAMTGEPDLFSNHAVAPLDNSERLQLSPVTLGERSQSINCGGAGI